MSLCLVAAGKTAVLAVSAFTLSWTHSVEKVEWREHYAVTPAGLVLTEAAVKGSGAGMEPGDGAVLREGWWVWRPDRKPLPKLDLAASGATVSDWQLCHADGCLDLGKAAGADTQIMPCSRTP
ncbi:DUF1850 domain-containing protein [Rhizobium sp. SSA_523]|uniref:DUF1850 domain-containing protein n=1 Tax=Rhizobium sp. SSA_523 TaxID=2952477 RepID=UPI002091805D|nr:DUF1850 domain-containing protein [Rhizobium sp. SSA_523]MCO5730508.1 DUF1850 domain-containing protein [Rhizobium sp. SSA_523]WKC25546.1 DUF1850 domain-containing protein [Rhizobium sp. SSA_523]